MAGCHRVTNGSTVQHDTTCDFRWELHAHNTHMFILNLKGYTNGFSTLVLSNEKISPLAGNVL